MKLRNALPAVAIGIAAIWAALPAASQSDQDIYQEAVAAGDRLPGDYERDADRKPATVLAFFGIGPGDKVLDLFSGGGYYSELLSRIVGPDGKVLAHSNKAYLNFVGDEFEARYANDRLPNVDVLMAENNELELAPASLDAIVVSLAYHDVYHADPEHGWAAIDKEKLLAELYAALKPGGTLGIVDHVANAGAPPETGHTLHRIDPELAISDIKAAGFELEARSDALRNPADDHSKLVFDPEIRGKTDRFVLRFRKPG